MVFTVNKHPMPAELHKFGWAMLAGFGVTGAVLWGVQWSRAEGAALWAWSGSVPQVTAVALWALGLGLWALTRLTSMPARRVYVAWMTGAAGIGLVMSTVVLTILFVLLLPVFSLLVRIGDPLRKKLTPGGTYWEKYKPHDATIDRMRRPF